METIIEDLFNSCSEISKLLHSSNPSDLTKEIGTNESNDNQKKIDIFSNDIISKKLLNNNNIVGFASEEDKNIIWTKNTNGKYFISFDPLDGSSNVDSNISIGTIFCIFNYSKNISLNSNDIVCAGYCLYGSSTLMVISKETTSLYLLDEKWKLLNNNLKIKDKGNTYAINESSKYIYDNNYNKLIDNFIELNYTARWVGSLVADIHRTIIKGGIIMYPGNKKNINGKIRLLYEAYPMAYIINNCGGKSYSHNIPLLDIPINLNNIHQKIPITYGSDSEISLYKKYII